MIITVVVRRVIKKINNEREIGREKCNLGCWERVLGEEAK